MCADRSFIHDHIASHSFMEMMNTVWSYQSFVCIFVFRKIKVWYCLRHCLRNGKSWVILRSEFPNLDMVLFSIFSMKYGCFKKFLARKHRTDVKIFILKYDGSNQCKTPEFNPKQQKIYIHSDISSCGTLICILHNAS